MARKRVKLAWIVNDSTRRTTLKKRRKGLLKKVKEISILCGVHACAVVYSPNDEQPEVWPTTPDSAAKLFRRFRNLPDCEKSRKMMNHETFLQQRITKMNDQLRRLSRENREAEMRALVLEGLAGRGFENVGLEDAATVTWLIEAKMKEIGKKIEVERDRVAGQQNWVAEMMSPWPEELTHPMYMDSGCPWGDDNYFLLGQDLMLPPGQLLPEPVPEPELLPVP